MLMPTTARNNGTVRMMRFLIFFWSMLKISATMSRQLRSAVSPLVTGQTTTPMTAKTVPTGPRTPPEIW